MLTFGFVLFATVLPDDFKKYFERFGKVLSAEVMFNRETQKSRGFGFIVFDNEEAVERVLRQPTHIIDGKMVRLFRSSLLQLYGFSPRVALLVSQVEVKRAIPRSKIPSGYRTSPSAGSDMRKNSHASLRSASPTESFHSLTHTASFGDLKDETLSASVGPIESRPAVSARAPHEASYAAALCNGGRPTRSQSEPAVTGGVIGPPEAIRRGTTETHSFVSPSRTATLYDVSTQGFSVGDSLAPDSDRFGAPGLSYPIPDSGGWAETPTAFPTSSPGTWMPSSVHASPSSTASRSLFSNGLGAEFSPPPRPAHTGQRMHSMSSDGYALTAGTDWGFSHALGSPHAVSPGSHLHGQSAFLPGGRAHSLSDPVIMPSSSPWTQLAAAAAHDPLPPLSLPPPEQPAASAQPQQHHQQRQQQDSVFFGDHMQQRSELPSSSGSAGHPGLFPAIGSPVFSGGFGESSGGYTSQTLSSAALSFSHL